MNLNHIVKSKFIKFTRKLYFQRSCITIGIRIFCAFHIGTYRTIMGHLITALIALNDEHEPPAPQGRRLRAGGNNLRSNAKFLDNLIDLY